MKKCKYCTVDIQKDKYGGIFFFRDHGQGVVQRREYYTKYVWSSCNYFMRTCNKLISMTMRGQLHGQGRCSRNTPPGH
jgi:hypothetical protein